MKFGTDWPSGFRGEDVENNGYVHVYSSGTGAGNPPPPPPPPGVNCFSLTVLLSQYSPLLQVFLH